MSNDNNALKVVFLGDSGVGKTTIISQFSTGKAPDTATPTVGAAYFTKDLCIEGKDYQLLIWDTAGQEMYRGLAPMYYRSASIAFITYDVTSDFSYQSVSYWLGELRDNCDVDYLPVIVGNKSDLEDQKAVDTERVIKDAESAHAIFGEVSALTGDGIERLFQTAVSEYLKRCKIHNKAVNEFEKAVPKKGDSSCGC